MRVGGLDTALIQAPSTRYQAPGVATPRCVGSSRYQVPDAERSRRPASVPATSFVLPAELEAGEPPEARGLARDEVRLMVSYARDDAVEHTRFTHFPEFLDAGDVLVVNTSATVNAALPATLPDDEVAEMHLSQRLPDGSWAVELRRLAARGGTLPLLDTWPGASFRLPEGGSVTLLAPYDRRPRRDGGTRLWRATLRVPGGDVDRYRERHGFPIRYGYVRRAWPLSYYQTVFAREPGSAEMPSAGRPFSARVLDALERKGVVVAPVLLHTGVASLEEHEPPYAEYFRVGVATARAVNAARRRGGRIVAVGTTVVRALESVARADGEVRAGEGWTELVIRPERGLFAVDALLTGFHEPRASHLAMLEALAGRAHVARAYEAALGGRYLWHEFGDVHLILDGRRGAAKGRTIPGDE